MDILEKIKKSKGEGKFDSCVFELPKGFAAANGLPSNSFAVLTLRNGRLEAEVFSPDQGDEKEVEEFLAEFGDFNEELKRLGD
ncbi:MAG: hypothetical protein R2747_12895 [Pyrinomonadaceae bacterium]